MKIDKNIPLTIHFDLDGTIRDFTAAVNEVYIKDFPENKDVVVSPAPSWNWFQEYPFPKQEGMTNEEVAKQWLFEEEAIVDALRHAPIYLEVQKGLTLLKEIKDMRGNIRIGVSTFQNTKANKIATLYWLANNNIEVDEIKFVSSWKEKWEHCDILFEDSPDVLIHQPLGALSFKIQQLYNEETPANYSADNFFDAVKILKQILI